MKYNVPGKGLAVLPKLSPSLKVLNCNDNYLLWLPEPLPPTLEELYVSGNQLRRLPTLPKTLKILFCASNFIDELPDLPDELEVICCNGNVLTRLPELPVSLKQLDCDENQLEDLPELYHLKSLKQLSCPNNALTYLPKLPPALEQIYCRANLIYLIPKLPPNLQILDINSNQLLKLPSPLPDTLQILNIQHNLLKELPRLPSRLTEISYDSNPFVYRDMYYHVFRDFIADMNEIQTILEKVRFLYFSIKFRNKFRKWLYERVRLKKAMKEMAPSNVKKLITDGMKPYKKLKGKEFNEMYEKVLDDIYDKLVVQTI